MTAEGGGALPVLWHLKVSHYNEKARWALDFKRVPHARRAVTPGRHRALAEKLTGAPTLPVLVVDGEAIGDSTRIIAELESRHPEPALYPADAAQRRRALEIEDFFDEELGPYTRLLLLDSVLEDVDLMLGTFVPDLDGVQRAFAKATFPAWRRQVRADFGIDERSVARARSKLRAAGERFRSELEPSGYLVGDSFTVADLTAAALVAPVVAPEQFPYPQPQRSHPLVEPLRRELARLGMLEWAREMYARHRGVPAEIRR